MAITKQQVSHQQIEMFINAYEAMNKHINTHGKIKPSSDVIKTWHTYTNEDYTAILACMATLQQKNKIQLSSYTVKNMIELSNLLADYGDHHPNLLYPTVADTKRLPDAITNAKGKRGNRTTKSKFFQLMMSMREAVCEAVDLYLPNDDTSKGALTPKPRDTLFEF